MSTLAANDRRSGPFVAVAGQVVFPADFPLFDPENIVVARWRPIVVAGVTTLAESVIASNAFTLEAVTDNGFNVRLVAGALAGDILVIASSTPAERGQAFEGATVRNQEIADQFDQLVLMIQELRRDALRAVVVPLKELAGPELPPIEERGDTLWVWSMDGSAIRYDRTLTQFDADVAEVRADTIVIIAIQAALELLQAQVNAAIAQFLNISVPAALAAVEAARVAALASVEAARTAALADVANARLAALGALQEALTGSMEELQVALEAALQAVDAETDARVDFLFAAAGILQPVNSNWEWAVADPISKRVVIGKATNGDLHLMHAGRSASLAQIYGVTDALGRTKARRHNLSVGATKTQVGAVITYGQSLEVAEKANDWLTGANRADCWMMGLSTRPDSKVGTTWNPQGGALVKTQLKATVDNGNAGIVPFADAAIPGLAKITYRGEQPVVAMTQEIARAWADDPRTSPREWYGISCGVGGQTIENLKKGAATNYYNRFITAVQKFKALCDAEGKSCSVSVIAWMQGEDNYNDPVAGSPDEDLYLGNMVGLKNDMCADAKAITGQTEDPIFIAYQTSGNWINDGVPQTLSISMAQLRASWEYRGIWCAGPNNFVTDNRDDGDSHLDANGYRWFGLHLARVAIQVLLERYHWEAFAPKSITRIGRTIFIDYNVPRPPLTFGTAWNGHKLGGYDTKGFNVYDLSGVVPIVPRGVEIIGATCLAITVDRDFNANSDSDITVRSTRDAGFNGNNELFDADDAYTPFSYAYPGHGGMTDSSNIAALVGKPYPMQAKSCEFELPVGWSR